MKIIKISALIGLLAAACAPARAQDFRINQKGVFRKRRGRRDGVQRRLFRGTPGRRDARAERPSPQSTKDIDWNTVNRVKYEEGPSPKNRAAPNGAALHH